ncbi:MAG: hypothetical protein GEU80_08200 [Dehalococcoidia bacterium]|nr:hypothetical protein [Dehalococcoidia bacterium]
MLAFVRHGETGGNLVDLLIGWPGGSWESTARLVAVVVGGYLFVLWLASILWVYRDIRSRTRDPISHLTGVAIATVFPLIGLPVYLVVRPSETLQEAYDRQLEQEAILSELHSISACPNCRRPVQDEFQVCAYCATQLKQPCKNCGHLLQFSWRHCPFCATARELPRREPVYEIDEHEEESVEERRRPAAVRAAARQPAQAQAAQPAPTAARRPAQREDEPADLDEDAAPRPRVTPRPAIARTALDE